MAFDAYLLCLSAWAAQSGRPDIRLDLIVAKEMVAPSERTALQSTWVQVEKAAIRLFATKGFAATGIRDVSAEAGVSSAALYHYMSSKEDLLVRIMREGLEDLIALAAAGLAGRSSPVDRLRQLVRVHVVTQGREPLKSRVVDYELRSLGPRRRREIVHLRDRYQEMWLRTIENGVLQGDFQVSDPHVTTLALLEMCNSVSNWYNPNGRLSIEEIGECLVELCLKSLGNMAASG